MDMLLISGYVTHFWITIYIVIICNILNQLQNYNWSQSNVGFIKEIIKSKNSKNEDLLNKMLGSHNFIKKIITENENQLHKQIIIQSLESFSMLKIIFFIINH